MTGRETIYLTLADAMAAHNAIHPARHPAVRDAGLLASALARPQATVGGVDAYPDLPTKAAALLHSLACNHALVDGNKRLAWVCTALFLEMNGVRLEPPSQQAIVQLVLSVATGEVVDVDDIAVTLRSWSVQDTQT